MDYFKATEKRLYSYRSIKVGIQSLEKALAEVALDYIGASAVDTTREAVSKTYKFSSISENEAIQREQKINRLKRRIRVERSILESIDNSLAVLSEEERKLVDLRYRKGYSWAGVAMGLGYSIVHCKGKLRRQIVEKMAVGMYGISILEDQSFKREYF